MIGVAWSLDDNIRFEQVSNYTISWMSKYRNHWNQSGLAIVTTNRISTNSSSTSRWTLETLLWEWAQCRGSERGNRSVVLDAWCSACDPQRDPGELRNSEIHRLCCRAKPACGEGREFLFLAQIKWLYLLVRLSLFLLVFRHLHEPESRRLKASEAGINLYKINTLLCMFMRVQLTV